MNILQSRSSRVVLVRQDQIPLNKLLNPKYVEETGKLNLFGNMNLLQDQAGNLIGLNLSNGLYKANDGKEIVVSNLTIESRKIQFKIESITIYADEYYHFLRKYLSSLSDSTDKEFLTPVISVDETEIMSNLKFPPNKLFSAVLYEQLTENLISKASDTSNNLAKARLGGMLITFMIDYEPLDFALLADSRINFARKEFIIQIATGYGLSDNVYSSKAPLNTEMHSQLLIDLENAIG